MLYTLALFAAEPIRFIKQYEWREMTEMEQCAMGTYWKSLGDALGISYEALPSGKTGFRDGIHWLDEIGAWSQQYEEERMKPHPRNKEIAEKTIDVLVYNLPRFAKPLGVYFVSFLMDDRLRNAMMYAQPLRAREEMLTRFQDGASSGGLPGSLRNPIRTATVLPAIPGAAAAGIDAFGHFQPGAERARPELLAEVRRSAVLCAADDLESLGSHGLGQAGARPAAARRRRGQILPAGIQHA